MACYDPLRVYNDGVKNNGKKNLVWRRASSKKGEEVYLPCGKCVGCLLERSRQWAVRCTHEASLYEKNCFITLTYNDENLPYKGSLEKSDFTLFMKRLRKKYGKGIRYYMCGEYGEKLSRPHYHCLIFNFDFEDKVLMKQNNGNRLYISETLSKLWPHGFSSVGDVTYESSAYVARYVMKKMDVKNKEEHYGGLQPEYTTMSRKPGIGKGWYDRYKTDLYPSDQCVVNGYPNKPPRFYDNLLDIENHEMYKVVKEKRKLEGKKLVPLEVRGKTILVDDNDSFRLPVKEVCCRARLSLYKRPLEEK